MILNSLSVLLRVGGRDKNGDHIELEIDKLLAREKRKYNKGAKRGKSITSCYLTYFCSLTFSPAGSKYQMWVLAVIEQKICPGEQYRRFRVS